MSDAFKAMSAEEYRGHLHKLGLTHKQAAEMFGCHIVTSQTYASERSSKHAPPVFARLVRLCSALAYGPGELSDALAEWKK